MFRARFVLNVVVAMQMLLQPVLMALPPRPVQANESPDISEFSEDAITLDMLPELEAAMESTAEAEPLYATVPVEQTTRAQDTTQIEAQDYENFRSSPMILV